MPLYKLHFLDRNEVTVTTREFSGVDDSAALAEGESLSRSHAISIWDGERKVGHIDKQETPKMRARKAL